MGCAETKEDESAQNLLVCAGCEKNVENADALLNYIGKKYCRECIKAIKDNNRRTFGTIQRVASIVPDANNQEVVLAVVQNPDPPLPTMTSEIRPVE